MKWKIQIRTNTSGNIHQLSELWCMLKATTINKYHYMLVSAQDLPINISTHKTEMLWLYLRTFSVVSKIRKARGCSSTIQVRWRLIDTYMHTFPDCTDQKTTMNQSGSNQELALKLFFTTFFMYKKSVIDCDRATYSAWKEDKEDEPCSLDTNMI